MRSPRVAAAVALAGVSVVIAVPALASARAPQRAVKSSITALSRKCSARDDVRFKVSFKHLVPKASYIISWSGLERSGATTYTDTEFTAKTSTYKKSHMTWVATEKLTKKAFVTTIQLDQLVGPGPSDVRGTFNRKVPKCS
jgi:hypothetical protein